MGFITLLRPESVDAAGVGGVAVVVLRGVWEVRPLEVLVRCESAGFAGSESADAASAATATGAA